VTNLLRATAMIQQRSDGWHVTLNTDKRSLKGVLIVPEKAASTIHNTGDGPLFLVRAKIAGNVSSGPVLRRIFELNGTEVENTSLAPQRTYLVVLEGPWPGKENSALGLVHDGYSSGLMPSGCLPPPPVESDETLGWIRNENLAPVSSC